MWGVLLKEFRAYFRTMIAFVFMGFFLLLSGLLFTLTNLSHPGTSDYTVTLSNLVFIFLFLIPILTMRLFAEESRHKTDQLLLTSPVSLTRVVVGKYLAALGILLLTLLATLVYPLLLARVGLVVTSEILGGYLGCFLLGACFIAIGLFVSALTENLVIAAVVTFSILLFVWVIEFMYGVLPVDRNTGVVVAAVAVLGLGAFLHFTLRATAVTVAVAAVGLGSVFLVLLLAPQAYDGLLLRTLGWFSLLTRYAEFIRGVLSPSPIAYYLTFSTAFVFLTIRVIDRRRWR